MSDWSEAEFLVDRAHELYEAGRWDEAERALRKAIHLNPYRAEWHFNLGLTLEAAAKYESAIEAFEAAYGLEPADPQTQVMVGLNLMRLSRNVDAVEWLERARRTDPGRTDAVVALIEAYDGAGDPEASELAFYESLHMHGEDEEDSAHQAATYAAMGEVMLRRGNAQRALYCLREAASLDSDLPRIHARLAAAYSETGRLERARQLYLKELRESPGDLDTLIDLGVLLTDMNRLAEASEKFRRVLEIESDNTDARFHLGELAQRRGLLKEAESAYRLVLRLESDFPGAARRLAAMLLDRGDVTEARRLLRRELRAWRGDREYLSASEACELADLLAAARLHRDAVGVYEELTKQTPTDPACWHGLSVSLLQSGERVRGAAAGREAIKLDPNRVATLHNLALVAIHDGHWRLAKRYIARIREVDPDEPSLRRLGLMLRAARLARRVSALLSRVVRRNGALQRGGRTGSVIEAGSARVEEPGVAVGAEADVVEG